MIEWQSIALVLLGGVLATVGWFARRLISGSHIDERAARLDKALDVAEKLNRSGMSIEQARMLADNLVSGRSSPSDETLAVLTQSNEISRKFSVLDTTAAMGVQLHARLSVLDAELAELFLKLEILISDVAYFEALKCAQAAWVTYREAEGTAAAVEMAGGTGRTVNALATEIIVTEARIEAVKSMLEDHQNRND